MTDATRATAVGIVPWQRWLFVACTLLLLTPLWSVPRVPTVDGPCHVYNAWVMRHVHDPAYPLIGATFRVDPSPIPNWLTEALLFLLLGVVPAAAAEKLLLTAYALIFAGAAWFWAGCDEPERRAHAFLALPFIYNFPFHLGLFNFILSVPLMLLAIGCWWRGRERLDWRFAALVNLLLLLCYFAHLVAFAVAGITIGLLWLLDFDRARWRRWLTQALVLVPQLALPLWYVSTHKSELSSGGASFALRWNYISRLVVLFQFPFPSKGSVGLALAATFALLVVVTLVRSRKRSSLASHGFPIAAALIVGIYFFGPDAIGEGSMLPIRLSMLPFLLVLPWIDPGPSRPLQGAVAVAVVLLVGWQTTELTLWNRSMARTVSDFLAGLGPLPPHRRVVSLVFDRQKDMEHLVLGHAVAYAAMEKGAVDWDDYEASTDHFPVRWRDGVPRPNRFAIELNIENFDVAGNAATVDSIYTWATPRGARLRRQLRLLYRRVAETGAGELWDRKGQWREAVEPVPRPHGTLRPHRRRRGV